MAIIRKLNKPSGEAQIIYVPEKKSHVSDHDDSNWIISYADMMTLLCIFFIMLFSMAKMNTPEFESTKKEMAEHFGAKYEAPTEDLGKFMNNVLIEAGVDKEATMTSDGLSVVVAFHSTLFFESMSAEISPAGKAILDKLAFRLAEFQDQKNKRYRFVIEGHTDSQPIIGGTYPSNWELSSSRATRVVRLFLDKKFDPKNLLAIGYADTQPVNESRNPDGTWNEANLAQNRRVVLRVLLPEADNVPWTGAAGAEVKEANRKTSSVSPPATAVAPAPVTAVAAPAVVEAAPNAQPIPKAAIKQ